ncbi:MAG: hypothetical protein HRT93_10390 [Piscirickettsiaceae bacterium]|nr:hypothetical protein [Piscirickettsiaceae bacterium]
MNWELITTISIAVIAFCALVLTIFQSKRAQEHNRLSVKPHLTSFGYHQLDKNSYTFELINNGLGPAIIKKFTIIVDGNIIAGEGTDPIKQGLEILFPNVKYQADYIFIGEDHAMAAKDKFIIVKVQFTGQQVPTLETIKHAFDERAELVIEYESFYGEKYIFPPPT